MPAKPPVFVSALALLLVLSACDRSGAFPQRAAQAGADAPDPGYRAPPQLGGVIRSPDGSVSLTGRALPSSRVRMASPAGLQIATTADGAGVWTASLGPVSEPALFRLAEETGGQRVEAEGLVVVLPGPPGAALLRAGAGAQVQELGSEPSQTGAGKAGALKILAVDYDSGGGAVVSGRAKASSPVRVLVDGQPAIEGAAGPDGRFSLTLPKPLAPGARQLQVLTPQGSAEASIAVSPPAPPKDRPYAAAATPFGWRIDWTTSGGGAQTTLLLGG